MVCGRFSMKNIRISLDAYKLSILVDMELEKMQNGEQVLYANSQSL